MKPELAVPLRGRSENDPGTNERVPQPPAGQASPSFFRDTFFFALQNSISCIRSLSKTHFVRDVPQKLKVEDVKTNFRARLPSKSESRRCENEAFVRGVLEKVKVEDVKQSFPARLP